MQKFVHKIESALKELSEGYAPPGSEYRSVVHQWIHAIATDSSLFAETRDDIKNNVIELLSKEGLFENDKSFRKKVYQSIHLPPSEAVKFRFIDLFAGIGGMRLGFQEAGGICVFSSEFEKNAQETYFQNHGDFPFGDITKIAESDIPDHDILVAGFPCQPFSHAGLKLGIDDTRGTLFYNIARILEEKKPKFAMLENVKGLISHDKGHTLKVILKTLTAIGYSCNVDKKIIDSGTPREIQSAVKHMVLSSRDFGVPQNRQRFYLVLWRDGLIDNFEYPKPIEKNTRVGDILEGNPDSKYTISDRLWDGHKRRKINNTANGKGFGFGLVTKNSQYTNTISKRYYKDGSEILIEQPNQNPRKLTPREAARIQGFPEEFIINKSDNQAYQQFGNSVSVPVVTQIAQNILERLL